MKAFRHEGDNRGALPASGMPQLIDDSESEVLGADPGHPWLSRRSVVVPRRQEPVTSPGPKVAGGLRQTQPS